MTTQTQKYKDVKAVSNSILTLFEQDLRAFKNYWIYNKDPFNSDEENISFELGSVVDTLLTRKDNFYDIYYVSQASDPTPQMKKFCRNLFKIWPTGTSTSQEREVLFQKAYEETKFGRDSLESVKKKFSECTEFFNTLVRARGKSVISQELYDRASKIVDQLLTNPFTKEIFEVKTVELGNTGLDLITVINQLEIYSEYTSEEGGCNIPIKGALDKVIIDHNKKIVYPYDIKTSSNLHEFKESYIKYRYFRQASYYTWLLKKWLREGGWVGYTIAPFKFIVASTVGEGAYIYECSANDLQASIFGKSTKKLEFQYGWKDLLDDICWHIQNNKWDYPRMVYENNGIIRLDEFYPTDSDLGFLIF